MNDDQRDTFLGLYASEWNSYNFTFVELRSERFPFLADFDGGPPVWEAAEDAMRAALRARGLEPGRVLWQIRGSNRHALWPDCIVDGECALAVTGYVQRIMADKFPGHNWAKIVDRSVVTGNGLRMLGSYKCYEHDVLLREFPEWSAAYFKIVNGNATANVNKQGFPYKIVNPRDGFYLPADGSPVTVETLKLHSVYRTGMGAHRPAKSKRARTDSVAPSAPVTGGPPPLRRQETEEEPSAVPPPEAAAVATADSVHVTKTPGAARGSVPVLTPDLVRHIERYVQGLAPTRADVYETWHRVVFAILNIAHSHRLSVFSENPAENQIIAWAEDLCHTFSKKMPERYDKGRVEAFLRAFKPRADGEQRLGISFLKMAYQDDRSNATESEAESEENEPAEKKQRTDPFDSALSLLKELRGRIALDSDELLWFNGMYWKTFTDQDLKMYKTKNAERRAKFYGASHELVRLASLSDDAVPYIAMRGRDVRDRIATRSTGYLTFRNGTLEFATANLVETTPNNAGLCAVDAVFSEEGDPQYDDKVQKFFQDAFVDKGPRDVFLHTLARAFAGHVEDKHLGMLVGLTGNSKTTLVNFVARAFHGACAHFTGAHLATLSCADPERTNSWLGPLEGLRVAFSDELTTAHLNGNRLKSVVPGDYATTRLRRLYEEGKEVLLTALLFFCLNSFPNIKPLDGGVRARVIGFNMKTTFVDPGDERLTENEEYVRERDPNLPRELRSNEKVHQALFRLILKSYSTPPDKEEAQKVKDWTLEQLDNPQSGERTNAGIVIVSHDSAIDDIFEFTNDDNDIIVNPVICRTLRLTSTFSTLNDDAMFKMIRERGAIPSGNNRRPFTNADGNKTRVGFYMRIKLRNVVHG